MNSAAFIFIRTDKVKLRFYSSVIGVIPFNRIKTLHKVDFAVSPFKLTLWPIMKLIVRVIRKAPSPKSRVCTGSFGTFCSYFKLAVFKHIHSHKSSSSIFSTASWFTFAYFIFNNQLAVFNISIVFLHF